MAQSLDNKGNVIVDGFSTNLNPTQYASQNTGSTAPIPSAISASNLATPQSQINVAQPNYNINQYQNTANSSQAYTASALADEQRIAEQNAQLQRDAMTSANSEIGRLTSSLQGKNSDTYAFNNQTGATDKLATLNRLNAESLGLGYAQETIPLQLQNQVAGQGVTDRGLAPIQTAQLRNNAIQLASNAYQSAIARNDYETAKVKADEMIANKYDGIIAEIEAKKTNLENIKYNLSSAEKKVADATAQRLAKEKADAEKKMADEKTMNELVMNASAQGAPQDIRDRAMKAKTPMEAANILGQFAGNYWAIEKTKAEVLKTRAEANAKSATGTGTVSATGTYIKGSDPQAEAWASRIANKQAKLSDVPSAIRTRVAMAMGSSPESTAKADETKQRMTAILSRLQGYKGVATGPKAQMFPVASQVDLPIPFSGVNQTSDALADAEALSALLTTENIALMKGLGSMSNIEFGNIEKIGSSILGRDKEGNAYFKGSKENYNREVKRLLDDLNKIPEMTQTSTPVPPTQSKWTQGDVQSAPTPLSSMAKKDYINPKSPFGTVDFNLPTKP